MHLSFTLILSILGMLTISCEQQSQSNKPLYDDQDSISIPTTKAYQYYSYDYQNLKSVNPKLLPQDTIVPFKGIIAKSDIVGKWLILDTMVVSNNDSSNTVFFNSIFGYTQAGLYILNRLLPDQTDQGELHYFNFSKDTVIIPCRYDPELEQTVLTRWRMLPGDSLLYVDYFKNVFGTKYASLAILKTFRQNQKQFIVEKLVWGEGGDYGQSIMLSRIMPDNFLKTYSLAMVDGDYSDTLVTLQCDFITGGIKLYKSSVKLNPETGGPSEEVLTKKYIGTYMLKDY